MQAEAKLLQVVGALGPPGGLAGGLHRRQQQRNQNRNDGDDHQQLDQREADSKVDDVGKMTCQLSA